MLPRVIGLGVSMAAIPFLLTCGGGGSTGPAPNDVASVTVSPAGGSTLASLGATLQFSAQAKNGDGGVVNGRTFTWSSTNEAAATITPEGGLATAVGNGTTTIRATVSGGTVAGSVTLTVQQVAASIVIDQAATSLLVGANLQLTATVRDAGSAVIPAAAVTWSSSNASVASVNQNSGMVTALVSGTTVITASSGTASAQKSLTVSSPALNIAKDTTISGNVSVDGFSIANGFTVTVDGPLTLRSSRQINIAGVLNGDCMALDVASDTAVTITGRVSNGCTAVNPGAPLRLSSNGELIVTGALIESSGEIRISNNPALSGHAAAALSARSPSQETAAAAGLKIAQFTSTTLRFYDAGGGPRPAPNGSNGVIGTNGTDGRNVFLILEGNVEFAGQNLFWAQDGGTGGAGFQTAATNVNVRGGDGGRGGNLFLSVDGILTFTGTNNFLRPGAGGNGGFATGTATANAAGAKAPSAIAEGGAGREPGRVEVSATGGIVNSTPQSFTVVLSAPGNGGVAAAQGADGQNATAAAAAQSGGDATATGGAGGPTPAAQVVLPGTIQGSPPVIAGPNGAAIKAGTGGFAKATAGKGGDGLKPNKNGAAGGATSATGGNGGNRDAPVNSFLGRGGDGGLAWFLGGRGGTGWSDCADGSFESGGSAGNGGNATGAEGMGGVGPAGAGVAGGVRFEMVGSGGSGGNGNPEGAAGAAGAQAVAFGGAPTNVGLNFQAGSPGIRCPQPNPPPGDDLFMIMTGWPANSLGQLGPGTFTRPIAATPGGVPNGQVLITTVTNGFNIYYVGRTPPPRLGQMGTHAWDLNVASVQVGGMFPNLESVTLCFLNESPPPSPANPIVVVQNDNFQVQQALTMITGPSSPPPAVNDGRAGCWLITLDLDTTHIRWFRPNGGTVEVDWIGFKIEATSTRRKPN